MKIPARPGPSYMLMLHRPTGERYAFRVEQPGFRVTGCLGPRPLNEWRRTDLQALDYDAAPELVPWANEHVEEFDLTG